MRKIGLVLIGIVIGALGSYFYFSGENVESSMAKQVIVKPKGLINPQTAEGLSQGFNSRHRLISDSIVKRPDNRSSWWSLQDLRNYLNYAENQAIDLGYTMNGVRLYLGAHPKANERAGLTTMFFAPTGSVSISESSMFYFGMQKEDNGDIPGAEALNRGSDGWPPNASYPQQ